MGKFRYQHITSSVKDKIPENLYTAEIAVNTYPGFEKLFFKNANDEVVSVMTSTQVINLIQSGMTDNTYFDGAEYDSNEKKINFKHGDTVEAFIDATAFIKDGMVDNVEIKEIEVPGGDPQKVLAITFNTDAGKEEIDIRLDDIFNPDNYYNKTEIDRMITDINSAITNINSAITEINSSLTENYYTKEEINEIEAVTAGALADLDNRKVEQAALDELEAVTAAALNDLDSRKVEQAALDELEAVTSAALNDLDNRKVEQAALDELEAVTAAALNELDNRKVEQAALDELEAVTAAALNDLDNRKVEQAALDELEQVTSAALNDLDNRKADKADVHSGVASIDSMNYNLSENTLYLYFTNSEGEQNITCSLDELTGPIYSNLNRIDDIPIITDMFHYGTDWQYVLGLEYHYPGDHEHTHFIEHDLTEWLSGCVRSAQCSIDPFQEIGFGRYKLNLSNGDWHAPVGAGFIWQENADDWFEDFYNKYVPASAETVGGGGGVYYVNYYTPGGVKIFSATCYDTNDNDYMTDLQYSNDSGKTLTAYNTNGNFSVTLDNLALDDDTISAVTISTNYGRDESLYLWKNNGKAVSAVVSTWFDYYANKLSGDSTMQTITLYNDHSQYCSSTVDLGSWFMSYVTNSDFSSFTTTTSSNVSTISGNVNTLYSSANTWNSLNSSYNNHEMDNCKHVTCDLQNYWNAKIGYAYYEPNYYDGTNTYPAIVFKTDNTSTMATVSVINATDFIKDGMVDSVNIVHDPMASDVLRITFNTDAGKSDIDIPLSSIFDPTNYYSKNDVDTLLMGYATTSVTNAITGDVSTISGNVSSLQSSANTFSSDISTLQQSANTFSSNISTLQQSANTFSNDISNLNRDVTGLTGTVQNLTSDVQTISGDVQSLQTNKLDSSAFTAHTADTTIHFTANDLISSGFVATTYTSTTVTDTIADNDMSPITSNAVYDWTDGVKIRKITQSDYDALVQAGTVDPNTLYIITD